MRYGFPSSPASLCNVNVVLNRLGGETLEKSLQVLQPGGQRSSISGPADPALAKEQRLSWGGRQVVWLWSYGIRRKAQKHGVSCTFVFVRANGAPLQEISALIGSGAIQPVVVRVFPFDLTVDALAHVGKGRAKGTAVVAIRL